MLEVVGCEKFEEMDVCGIGKLAEGIGVEIEFVKLVLTVLVPEEAGEGMVSWV